MHVPAFDAIVSMSEIICLQGGLSVCKNFKIFASSESDPGDILLRCTESRWSLHDDASDVRAVVTVELKIDFLVGEYSRQQHRSYLVQRLKDVLGVLDNVRYKLVTLNSEPSPRWLTTTFGRGPTAASVCFAFLGLSAVQSAVELIGVNISHKSFGERMFVECIFIVAFEHLCLFIFCVLKLEEDVTFHKSLVEVTQATCRCLA